MSGWKQIHLSLPEYTLFYINGKEKLAQLSYSRSNLEIPTNGLISEINIPSTYCPNKNIYSMYDNTIKIVLTTTGNLQFVNYTSQRKGIYPEFILIWKY